jgi:hypothetical protein
MNEEIGTNYNTIDWGEDEWAQHVIASYTDAIDSNDVLQKPSIMDANDVEDALDVLNILDDNSPTIREDKIVLYNGGEIDRDTERLLRMGQVVGKFASTLALKPIRVEVTPEHCGGAPAWSDSETIYFQSKDVGDVTKPEVVTSIKGLSLHETAHIMLTPRDGSKLSKEVKKADLWRAFNALEDQRIEMYMTTRFGNTYEWLSATIAQHIIDKPEQHSVCFPIIHGRKYLPASLREQVQSMYEDQPSVSELCDLIDRYIVLNLGDPKNYTVAFEIITRYNELVNKLPSENEEHCGLPRGFRRITDPNGHHVRPGNEWKSSSNKPMSKGEQEGTSAKVAAAVAASKGQGKGEQEGEGNSNILGDTDVKNGTPPSSDGYGGKGAGTGGKGALTKLAKDIVDQVLASKAQEIRNAVKQYSGETELSAREIKEPKRDTEIVYVGNKPSFEATQAVKSFARELYELKAQYDPGWNRRTEQGKLNVQRYSVGTDLEECFDEWDMGREDAVDIEAVLLLDNSWSMHASIHGAYESMWAIKRALDKINASTTVVTFSNVTRTLYSAKERAGKIVPPKSLGDSTDPYKSLVYARSVLANSKRAIKVLIPITDGVWSEAKECNDLIRQMRKAGVITALGMIGAPVEKHENGSVTTNLDTHGCEVAVSIDDMAKLFVLAKNMVKVGIERNLSR